MHNNNNITSIYCLPQGENILLMSICLSACLSILLFVLFFLQQYLKFGLLLIMKCVSYVCLKFIIDINIIIANAIVF